MPEHLTANVGKKHATGGSPVFRFEGKRCARMAGVGAILFAAVVVLQWLGGAFKAELTGYPDEAAHYLSGMLVRDYLASGTPIHALDFAQRFYMRYPYVAIGHWPPVFYIIEGLWMLFFSSSRTAVILLMALITTLLAASTYEVLRVRFGEFAALATAFLLISIPVVQQYSAMVMLDTCLALFGFWATLAFGRLLRTENWRDALVFSLLSSLAILTKGNGFYLALLPPVAVILTRRWYLLKRLAFWLPLVIVSAVAVPWHILTMHLMLPTFVGVFGLEFTETALRFYGLLILQSLGPVVLGFAIIGFYARIVKPGRGEIDPMFVAALALLISMVCFYCTLPAGIGGRYFIAAMPVLCMFFVAGVEFISSRVAVARIPLKHLFMIAALAVFGVMCFTVPEKEVYGYRAATARLMSQKESKGSLILVSSDDTLGEGLFISEVAMNGDPIRGRILRASKVLADDNWNGTDYKPRYSGPHALASCLNRVPIQFIVLDAPARAMHYKHHEQLWQIVKTESDRWALVGVFSGKTPADNSVYIYKAKDVIPALAEDVSRYLTSNMKGSLKNWPVVMRLVCEADASPNGPVPKLQDQ